MKALLIFSVTVFLSVPLSGRSASLNGIAEEILEETWRFHPVHATYKGIHDHDTLLGDYSRSALEKREKQIAGWIGVLDTIDSTQLSIDDQIDHRLLRIHLSHQLFNLRTLRSYEKDPLIYVSECIDGIYAIMLRSSPSTASRIAAIRARLRLVPPFLEEAKRNLKHPPAIFCDVGNEQIAAAEDLIDDIYATFRDSLPAPERRAFLLEKNKAIASLWVFGDWLTKHADPNASGALGRAQYEYKLKQLHLLNIDSDSLLCLGKKVLQETIGMIDSLEALQTSPAPETVDVPEGFGKGQVMAYREDEIAFMREHVSGGAMVTVPDWVGGLRVVETPGFLRAIIPGIAMMPPGPFEDEQTGYFYVRPLPDVFGSGETEYFLNYVRNRWFRGSVVHEGYPGHHLQICIANRHPSAVRRCFHDYFLIEGWALYCEAFMAQSGLYADPLRARIGVLRGVKFRAARVVVDCMLQTEQWTYGEAVRYMQETVGGDSVFLAKEVRRYLTDPAQASSYLVGKLQILALREKYAEMMGDEFTVREFHDRLLREGSIPVSLIARKLLLHAGKEQH